MSKYIFYLPFIKLMIHVRQLFEVSGPFPGKKNLPAKHRQVSVSQNLHIQ